MVKYRNGTLFPGVDLNPPPIFWTISEISIKLPGYLYSAGLHSEAVFVREGNFRTSHSLSLLYLKYELKFSSGSYVDMIY